MKPETKTRRAPGQVTLTISLPKDLKERIEEAARAETRSTSNYLVKELARLLATMPGLSEEQQPPINKAPTKKRK